MLRLQSFAKTQYLKDYKNIHIYFPLTEVLKAECTLLEMKRWASDGVF